MTPASRPQPSRSPCHRTRAFILPIAGNSIRHACLRVRGRPCSLLPNHRMPWHSLRTSVQVRSIGRTCPCSPLRQLQGSITSRPQPAKSPTLRVVSRVPCWRAMAAIYASNCAIGRVRRATRLNQFCIDRGRTAVERRDACPAKASASIASSAACSAAGEGGRFRTISRGDFNARVLLTFRCIHETTPCSSRL